MRKEPRRPSAPLIISCIALFVALAGTAYAVVEENSVGSKEVKPDSLKAQDLADHSVTFLELAPDAVNPSKILNGAIFGREIGDTTIEVSNAITVQPGSNNTGYVECPGYSRLLSGGPWVVGDGRVFRSQPASDDRWYVSVDSGPGTQFYVYALCL
jgi:hypothetical protein